VKVVVLADVVASVTLNGGVLNDY